MSIVGNTIINPKVQTHGRQRLFRTIDTPDYLLISNNRISDYQAAMSMTAAIGGTWGVNGLSEGNYYGRRINTAGYFPPDLSYGVADPARIGVERYDVVTPD